MRPVQRTILTVVFLYVCSWKTTAQVFVFRDVNQELLGLVSCVASDFNELSGNTEIRLYQEYIELYSDMREWLLGSEAVAILRELFDKQIVTRDELPALAVVYREGFTGIKEQYLVPSFMSPANGATQYVERFVECLRELARDEKFNSLIAGPYRDMYSFADDGSYDIYEETGDVIVAMEEILQIPPPVNYLNYFSLFSQPYQNFRGFVETTDGSRVAYVVNGIGYSEDKEAWFDMSPELFLNMYALCVTENAKALNPGYDAEFYRLYTAHVREIAESSELYTDIDSYMVANASLALTAFMFAQIGNAHYKEIMLSEYKNDYLYSKQLYEILVDKFLSSGIGFYEFFPEWFKSVDADR